MLQWAKDGTDVAKSASDMILADDNFVTIVEAVKIGRHIYDNIKKAIHFLLATNIGEVVAIFVGLLIGMDTPLTAIQLLWVNLITDSFPAIALGLEKPEYGIMDRKPLKPDKGLFSDGMWEKIVVEGTMIGILTLLCFSIGNKFYGIDIARSMAFISLSMTELIHSFNIKSNESIFKSKIFENPYLIASFVVGTLLQLAVVQIKPIANVFGCTPLDSIQWLIVAVISSCPIFIIEAQKKINEIKFGKRIYSFQR